MASALGFLTRAKVIHGDVAARNVLVGEVCFQRKIHFYFSGSQTNCTTLWFVCNHICVRTWSTA